ncbi:MAG: hypothetical protein JWN15_4433 [Firmicutes bacterium]|nr:hypothetical protein [Bacillota bacterium]
MATKRSESEPVQDRNKALEEFLRSQMDTSIHEAEDGRLELRLSGTDAYLSRYTKKVMDKNHGVMLMAIETRTDKESKRVFLQPGKRGDTQARTLHQSKTMGTATFAFGVPLRKLGIKIPAGRRIILPLTPMDTPDHGTVYWASLADVEVEKRNLDPELIAAKKHVKTETAKLRRAARIKRHIGKLEPGTEQ